MRLPSAGGYVSYDRSGDATLRLKKNSGETWCHIAVANQPSGVSIRMVIIEKQAMQQELTLTPAPWRATSERAVG